MPPSFDLEVCRRLPLADAALRLLDFATDDDFLDDVFARHRGRSYQDVIRFPLMVHLIADALVGHRGSAHQTFQKAQDDGALTATVRALYGKLRRVPIGLSQAFFAGATARLDAVLPTQRPPATVSLHLLFEDVAFDLTAWFELLDLRATQAVLAAVPVRTADDLRRYLQTILASVWQARWAKSPTKKRPPKGPPRAYLRGGHSSVHKILRGEHQEIPIVPKKPPPPASTND